MSLIDYNLWMDHPIGKGVSFFVGFLVLVFGFINLNTLGRYGYGMGLDNLWFLFLCLVFIGTNVKYGRVGQIWRVEYCLFGLKLKSNEYQGAKLEADGKLFRLYFLENERYVPSPIVFQGDSLGPVKTILGS